VGTFPFASGPAERAQLTTDTAMRLASRFALLDAWRSWRNHAPWAVAGGDVICRGADSQGLTGPRRAAGGSQAQQQLAGGLYVVPFPKLSHRMEKGKLIKWHKAIGDRVNMVRTNTVRGLTKFQTRQICSQTPTTAKTHEGSSYRMGLTYTRWAGGSNSFTSHFTVPCERARCM
jgi:hypothetical protein